MPSLALGAIHLMRLHSTPIPLDGLHEEQQQRHDQAVQRHTLGQANEDEGLTEGLVVLGDAPRAADAEEATAMPPPMPLRLAKR